MNSSTGFVCLKRFYFNTYMFVCSCVCVCVCVDTPHTEVSALKYQHSAKPDWIHNMENIFLAEKLFL